MPPAGLVSERERIHRFHEVAGKCPVFTVHVTTTRCVLLMCGHGSCTRSSSSKAKMDDERPPADEHEAVRREIAKLTKQGVKALTAAHTLQLQLSTTPDIFLHATMVLHIDAQRGVKVQGSPVFHGPSLQDVSVRYAPTPQGAWHRCRG